MEKEKDRAPSQSAPPLTRREFVARGGAALAGAMMSVAGVPRAAASGRRLRNAIVGTGGRGTLSWGKPIVETYSDVAEIVGLCDINRKRVEASKKIMGTTAPTFVDFDLMVEQTRPEVVVVTTVDAAHARYITRGLELGCDVISEKPLCTDEKQCQAILDAQRKARNKVIVAHNARHYPETKKMKELLMEKAIGEVISVDYHEYLDTGHGASYFRRWHRLKENSGTLLVTKACHHFDQVNWLIGSTPVEVVAHGDLRIYGRNHPFRGTHCRACPYTKQCKFYWDITPNELLMKLYAACESEDGYFIDGCVWREDTNIYDTMAVLVKYENGAQLTYTANAFLPYEGQAISFNGREGRIDWNNFEGGGFKNTELRLTRNFGKSEIIRDLARHAGGHGGADGSMQDMIFRTPNAPDPLGLRADVRQGALAALVGIAAYKSIERGGEPIRIADLVRL